MLANAALQGRLARYSVRSLATSQAYLLASAALQRQALSVLLQHKNSNYVARVCATTNPYGGMPFGLERVIAYLRVSTQRQHRSGSALMPNGLPSSVCCQ